MILLVLFVLVVAELVAVRLWDEFHTVEPDYLDRSPAPITEKQKQSAVDLVQASGIVERISEGQVWEATDVRDHPRVRTVGVYVEWMEPVESDGPWLTSSAPEWLGRSCRNVRSRFHVSISNVRYLWLLVSLEGMEIVRLWPHSSPGSRIENLEGQPDVGQGNFLGSYEIYNEKDDRLVYKGPMVFSEIVPGTCPRGERYD